MQEINEKKFKIKLGKKVKEFRKSLNLTQEEMAEESSMSVDFVSRIEVGSANPSSLKIVQIANALSITPNNLLDEFITDKKMALQDTLLRELNKLTEEDIQAILRMAKYIGKKNDD